MNLLFLRVGKVKRFGGSGMRLFVGGGGDMGAVGGDVGDVGDVDDGGGIVVVDSGVVAIHGGDDNDDDEDALVGRIPMMPIIDIRTEARK